MPTDLPNLRGCIHFDERGAIFCVSDFIRVAGLPDDMRLRSVIIEEVREIMPGVRILEELN
jgi:hypothetical protein